MNRYSLNTNRTPLPKSSGLYIHECIPVSKSEYDSQTDIAEVNHYTSGHALKRGRKLQLQCLIPLKNRYLLPHLSTDGAVLFFVLMSRLPGCNVDYFLLLLPGV